MRLLVSLEVWLSTRLTWLAGNEFVVRAGEEDKSSTFTGVARACISVSGRDLLLATPVFSPPDFAPDFSLTAETVKGRNPNEPAALQQISV